MYPKYCWQHSQKKFPFKIKDSGLPNAGKGLFTTTVIKKNELIHKKAGYYGGKRMTQAAFDATNSTYGVRLSGNQGVIDGASTQSSLLRRSNTKKQGQGSNNAKLVRINRRGAIPERVGAKATVRIPAGREVFTRYGAGYWDN